MSRHLHSSGCNASLPKAVKPFASRVLFHVRATEYLSSLTFLVLPGSQLHQQKQQVGKSDRITKQTDSRTLLRTDVPLTACQARDYRQLTFFNDNGTRRVFNHTHETLLPQVVQLQDGKKPCSPSGLRSKVHKQQQGSYLADPTFPKRLRASTCAAKSLGPL